VVEKSGITWSTVRVYISRSRGAPWRICRILA
jgi:hypothetical protein